MTLPISFNGRSLHHSITGVQRCVREWHHHLPEGAMTVTPPSARWASGVKGHLWEQFALPRNLQGILWSPGNTGPLSVHHQVVTIHDATTLDHPEWFSTSFSSLYRWLLPRLARNVLGITTVSQFSKERLLHHFQIPEDRIHVVPNGVGREFHTVGQGAISRAHESMGLHRPYILFVGSIEPRKNVTTLLKAWQAASLKDCELVIVGARSSIFEHLSVDVSTGGVRFLGRVPNETLVPLYCGALASVTPSLYEGFGLPILESLACGTPCIASDIPAHREVGGNEAILIPPRSVDGWAEAIRSVAGWSSSERDHHGKVGRRRAETFSWETSTAKHVAILNSYAKEYDEGSKIVSTLSSKNARDSGIASDRITLLGRDYLLGRKLGRIVIAFLFLRDFYMGWALAVRKSPIPELSSLREICICKYDHLGDLLMATAFLKHLRIESPKAHITLIVSETSLELGNLLHDQGMVDEIMVLTPLLLNRSSKNLPLKILDDFSQFLEVALRLRQRSLDLFIDLRIHSPNAWLLAILSRARFRCGFGLRGMSSIYHAILPYSSRKSFPQLYLDCLPGLVHRALPYTRPVLDHVDIPLSTPSTVSIKAKLPTEPFIVIQMVAGEASRNLDQGQWTPFLSDISRRHRLLLIGNKLPRHEQDQLRHISGLTDLTDQTSLREALVIIGISQAVISVDSFSAHVGLAYQKPVALLMKTGFSNPRSYPSENKHLRFFDARNLDSGMMLEFLQGS